MWNPDVPKLSLSKPSNIQLSDQSYRTKLQLNFSIKEKELSRGEIRISELMLPQMHQQKQNWD